MFMFIGQCRNLDSPRTDTLHAHTLDKKVYSKRKKSSQVKLRQVETLPGVDRCEAAGAPGIYLRETFDREQDRR